MLRGSPDLCALLGDVSTPDALFALLGERDPAALSAREVACISRAAKRVEVPGELRVAFCGTHTFDPLPEYLRAYGLSLRVGIATYIAPFGQYMQPLLSDGSELRTFDPQVLLVSLALRQIAPRLYSDFSGLSEEELESEREKILQHLTAVTEVAVTHTSAVVLLSNFPRPAQPALGIADAKQAQGETEFYLALNLELLRQFKGSDRVYVFDADRLIGGVRLGSADRTYFMTKAVWGESDCNAIAQELMRYVVAATGRARKCLVVDLDNTLWGGVVGEDGPSGVAVGQGSALAEAFESHQFAIRALRRRGVMLAVCSKNNPPDVDEIFASRTDMPIRWSDFSAAEIGWNDKASGIRGLAAQLNIGEDSLVFVDDNPAERAIVRGELPGVTVPELPRDPADYAGFLRQQVCFEKLRVSQDDLVRLKDYEANRGREQLRAGVSDLEIYLSALQTRIVVRRALGSDVGRVHELFNKTNQFNLTTRRYSLADVQSFVEGPRMHLGIVTAEDRFGSMGTVGVYLLRQKEEAVVLDSFLLSCRALGRGVETAMMNCVKQEAQQLFGSACLRAEFIPSAKNAPAVGFLSRHGFTLVGRQESGAESYVADVAGLQPQTCPHITIDHQFAPSLEHA